PHPGRLGRLGRHLRRRGRRPRRSVQGPADGQPPQVGLRLSGRGSAAGRDDRRDHLWSLDRGREALHRLRPPQARRAGRDGEVQPL
ncbi:hypothetical protein HK102_011598, partial [Quaeritorhiza haematococci]